MDFKDIPESDHFKTEWITVNPPKPIDFGGISMEQVQKDWDDFQKRFGTFVYDETHLFEPDERLVRTIQTSPKKLIDEHTLFKHRLETINEYIESRKENMLPEHYDDLKYIANECDLESSW